MSFVSGGSALSSVSSPVAVMLMTSGGLESAFAAVIASRSEPVPESAVFVTGKLPAEAVWAAARSVIADTATATASRIDLVCARKRLPPLEPLPGGPHYQHGLCPNASAWRVR